MQRSKGRHAALPPLCSTKVSFRYVSFGQIQCKSEACLLYGYRELAPPASEEGGASKRLRTGSGSVRTRGQLAAAAAAAAAWTWWRVAL